MAIAAKLKSFLDGQKVRYHVLAHHERFTSPEIAQELHVPGHMMAKVVVVRMLTMRTSPGPWKTRPRIR